MSILDHLTFEEIRSHPLWLQGYQHYINGGYMDDNPIQLYYDGNLIYVNEIKFLLWAAGFRAAHWAKITNDPFKLEN